MSFNYEQSIWGRGEASLRWGDPTAFRLQQALSAVRELPHGGRVLEVGSGAGQFIRAIKKQHPEFECLGCDISWEALEAAKKTNDGVHYQLCDEKRLPYEDKSVDVVLIFDVLEHVSDPAATLKEIHRILKKDGILYAFVPCEGDWLSIWHLLDVFGLKRNLTKKYAGHIQYFSREGLFDLVKNSGLEIKRVRYSEHLIGQLLGIAAFNLMNRVARKRGVSQINNETYFAGRAPKKSRIFRNFVNALVYIESELLCRVPSPNVHLTASKRDPETSSG